MNRRRVAMGPDSAFRYKSVNQEGTPALQLRSGLWGEGWDILF